MSGNSENDYDKTLRSGETGRSLNFGAE
ncbi:MAG: hypothetical protein EZS28_016148, partial [Streblomastix strix]